MFSKKGAMFGLDARIALAIFGALSVISGAALYSAIQSAKAEQWRQFFVETIKSTEQYYLDNAEYLEVESTGFSYLYTRDLVENRKSLLTWKGPYMSGVRTIRDDYLRTRMTNQIHQDALMRILLRTSGVWVTNGNTTSNMCVIGSYDCSQWITVDPFHSGLKDDFLLLFNSLDEVIDGGDGQLKGTIRYNAGGSGKIMYKGMPQKRVV